MLHKIFAFVDLKSNFSFNLFHVQILLLQLMSEIIYKHNFLQSNWRFVSAVLCYYILLFIR